LLNAFDILFSVLSQPDTLSLFPGSSPVFYTSSVVLLNEFLYEGIDCWNKGLVNL
jgi:hypothetical protein